MAIGYNPTTVTEGLIYYIDPNNNRSYSGIGNTVYNLVNSGFGGTFVGSTASPLDSTNTRTFYINNSTNYINGPNNIALTNNFTVSVWFKIGVYNTGSIIGKWFWDGTSAHRCWIMNTDVSTSSMAIVLSSDGTYTSPTIKRYLVPVSLNEYTQITFTFTSGTLLVYKNGVLATVTKSIDGTFSTAFNAPTRPIQIGYFFDFSAYYNLANVGVAQIYNRVLSPSEILQNYNATKKRYLPEEQIVTDGLILNLDPGNPNSYSGAGNTIYDLAGFGNTGTLTNGPTFSVLNGGSILFDGSNDFIGASSSSSLDISTNLSAAVWMKLIAIDGSNRVIFSKTNNINPFLSNYEAYLKNNVIYWWDSPTERNTTVTLSLGSWTQVVFVRSSTSLLIYKNGSLANTITVNQVGPVVGDFFIGKDVNGQFLNFNLAQFLFYNRALSAQEVQQNYNATKNRFINVLPPVRDNLILELDAGNLSSYPGSGTTWFDLSGNNLNGTLTNGPTYSFLDSASSIVTDGVDDYIEVLDNSLLDFGTNNFTVEYWFKKLALTNGFDNFWGVNKWNTGGTPGTNEWTLNIGEFSSIECVHFLIESGNTTYTTGVHTLPNPTSQLHQVVGIRNGSKLELYLDGAQLYSNTPAGMGISTSVNNVSGLNLRVANTAPSNLYTNSSSAVVKIYNRALSAAEIAQNFNFYRTRYGI